VGNKDKQRDVKNRWMERRNGRKGWMGWRDGEMESVFTVSYTVVHEHKIILKSYRVNMRSKE